MPVSSYFQGHGDEVMGNMQHEYGDKKGESVFYATANKRKQKPSSSIPKRMASGGMVIPRYADGGVVPPWQSLDEPDPEVSPLERAALLAKQQQEAQAIQAQQAQPQPAPQSSPDPSSQPADDQNVDDASGASSTMAPSIIPPATPAPKPVDNKEEIASTAADLGPPMAATPDVHPGSRIPGRPSEQSQAIAKPTPGSNSFLDKASRYLEDDTFQANGKPKGIPVWRQIVSAAIPRAAPYLMNPPNKLDQNLSSAEKIAGLDLKRAQIQGLNEYHQGMVNKPTKDTAHMGDVKILAENIFRQGQGTVTPQQALDQAFDQMSKILMVPKNELQMGDYVPDFSGKSPNTGTKRIYHNRLSNKWEENYDVLPPTGRTGSTNETHTTGYDEQGNTYRVPEFNTKTPTKPTPGNIGLPQGAATNGATAPAPAPAITPPAAPPAAPPANMPPGAVRVGGPKVNPVKQLDDSYKYHSTELEKVAAPITMLGTRLSNLDESLKQASPTADSLLSPELLSVVAGGAGSGLRMTQSEIDKVLGGRSHWESLKAAWQQWSLDPSKAGSITPEQRQQMKALSDAIKAKVMAKQQAIIETRRALMDPKSTPQSHKEAWAGLQEKLSSIDFPQNDNPKPGTYVIGHIYNGMTYLGPDPNSQASWKPAPK